MSINVENLEDVYLSTITDDDMNGVISDCDSGICFSNNDVSLQGYI